MLQEMNNVVAGRDWEATWKAVTAGLMRCAWSKYHSPGSTSHRLAGWLALVASRE